MPIERRTIHEGTNINTNTNAKSTASDEDHKLGIRVFNWEGIHFEVSPKRDGSCESSHNMKKDYNEDMNLMVYNFNSSINRNGSESPKPSVPSKAKGNEVQKKIVNMYNKTTNNFVKKMKKSNGTQSPISALAKKNNSRDNQTKAKAIEETISEDKKKSQQYSSPRQLADTKIKLENEARRILDRSEGKTNPEGIRRKKSPPPLTPITNNSTLRSNNISFKEAKEHNFTTQAMCR
jgi:hypothetical protein